MDSKTVQYLSLGLLVVGTAASVLYLLNRGGGSGGTGPSRRGVVVRPNTQVNRDANLGQAGKSRKYFGFRGVSSAQGAGAGAGFPQAVGIYGQRGTIGRGQQQNSTNPKYGPGPAGQFQKRSNGYQNGKNARASVAAAVV